MGSEDSKMSKSDMLIIDLCAEVDCLRAQLTESKEEEKYYRNKYISLIDDNIKHGEVMMSNLLEAIINKKGY